MNEPLEEYKLLIDGLVKIKDNVNVRRIKKGVWNEDKNPPQDHIRYNTFLASLSEEQREIMAEIVQGSRLGGIHDVLAFLHGNYNGKVYKILYKDIELPYEPYGTEIYYDFVARAAGDAWPDEKEGLLEG